MKKQTGLAGVVLGTAYALVLSACASVPVAQDASIKVEGESFAKERNGSVIIVDDRPGTSGGKAFRAWDFETHEIDWNVEVPVDGNYLLVLRMAAGREWTVYRSIKLDGAFPVKDFEGYAVPPTGGFGKDAAQWKSFFPADAADKPILVNLKKGKHVVTMINLGAGDDGDGAANLDYFELLSGKLIEKVLPTAMVLKTGKPKSSVIGIPPVRK